MTDIWPYGPPAYVTWQQVFGWFTGEGYPAQDAAVFAAIASAESGLDYRVINDTPSTGDYSVGLFEINYYGNLYASRVKEFGTPQTLIEGGLSRQCYAALTLWLGRGKSWADWSTYNSGAYLHYLHGYSPPAGGGGGGGEPTISEGATGPAVVTLQQDLSDLGYGLTVDGVFGPVTRGDVIDFQRRHGLSADGVVGPLTWSALARATVPPAPATVPPLSAPPPPPASAGDNNVDGRVLNAWSNLATKTGPDAVQQINTMAGYASRLIGARR